MKLIKASYEILEQPSGLEGIYKMIEIAGRTCYKSEDKITEDSAKEFVQRMIDSGHGAMLEHGTVYLDFPTSVADNPVITFFKNNPYSKVRSKVIGCAYHFYITTNLRVLVEGFTKDYYEELLNYICEPTEYHERRYSVRFICDRGVSHEFVRHRVMSFAQESTRYCNYSKDKFGNEIAYIKPCWLDIPEGRYTNISRQNQGDGEYIQIMLHEDNITAYPLTTTPEGRFLWHCLWAEHDYFDLLEQGWKPQQARAVLPNALKTELVVTGFASDWVHFFELRDSEKVHPQAFELAHPLCKEFVSRGYIKSMYDLK